MYHSQIVMWLMLASLLPSINCKVTGIRRKISSKIIIIKIIEEEKYSEKTNFKKRIYVSPYPNFKAIPEVNKGNSMVPKIDC